MDPLSIASFLSAGASLGSSLFGSNSKGMSGKPQKLSNFDSGQQGLWNQYMRNSRGMQGGFNNAQGILQQYLDPQSDIYKNFEQPYMQQFQQQTVPRLAEQFAGLGGGMGGGLSSSGFGQALGAAGGNLQTSLAQMKSGMQRNAIQDILSQYNQMNNQAFGTQPFSYYTQDTQGGFGPNFLQGLGNISPGTWQGMFSGLGGGRGQKSPLSGVYDQMFRQDPSMMGY